jgi:hypothetical protein
MDEKLNFLLSQKHIDAGVQKQSDETNIQT